MLGKIIVLLDNYGVNSKSNGFYYTKEVLENVYFNIKNNNKYKLNTFIKEIALRENKSVSTIKNSIRYAVTSHNTIGGNLTLKDLERIIKKKVESGEI